jgi:hypothetical protein
LLSLSLLGVSGLLCMSAIRGFDLVTDWALFGLLDVLLNLVLILPIFSRVHRSYRYIPSLMSQTAHGSPPPAECT